MDSIPVIITSLMRPAFNMGQLRVMLILNLFHDSGQVWNNFPLISKAKVQAVTRYMYFLL